MSQAQGGALLRPIRSDSLLRRMAAQPPQMEERAAEAMPLMDAQPAHEAQAEARVPVAGTPLMRPLGQVPPPVRRAAAVSVVAKEPDPLTGFGLFASDLLNDPDDDWPDEEGEDAVPTVQMPVPVSVPLTDFESAACPRRWPWVLVGALCVLAAGFMLWKMGFLPLT